MFVFPNAPINFLLTSTHGADEIVWVGSEHVSAELFSAAYSWSQYRTYFMTSSRAGQRIVFLSSESIQTEDRPLDLKLFLETKGDHASAQLAATHELLNSNAMDVIQALVFAADFLRYRDRNLASEVMAPELAEYLMANNIQCPPNVMLALSPILLPFSERLIVYEKRSNIKTGAITEQEMVEGLGVRSEQVVFLEEPLSTLGMAWKELLRNSRHQLLLVIAALSAFLSVNYAQQENSIYLQLVSIFGMTFYAVLNLSESRSRDSKSGLGN